MQRIIKLRSAIRQGNAASFRSVDAAYATSNHEFPIWSHEQHLLVPILIPWPRRLQRMSPARHTKPQDVSMHFPPGKLTMPRI